MFGIGSLAQEVEVAIVALAASDVGARRGINRQTLVVDGDAALIIDPHPGLLAPDIGPPRASGDGAQDRALFLLGLADGGLRGHAQFPVDFVLIGVLGECCQELIGFAQVVDLIGGQKGGQAFLPIIVAPLDFAFGLGRRGKTQGDAVEVERGPSWVKASGWWV